jgi:hypothetical protein
MTRRAGSRWLSRPAVLWAFYDAEGVPTHLVAALIVVAAHAGEDGRGAYPSVATVAAAIRKNKRNTKRDLAELCELGLLLPGDASLARKIRADRRPNVYDLPMLRGGADDTPYSSDGVSHRTARGVAQGHHGVSRMTPEKSLKRPRRIPPGAGERADPIEQIIEAFKPAPARPSAGAGPSKPASTSSAAPTGTSATNPGTSSARSSAKAGTCSGTRSTATPTPDGVSHDGPDKESAH